MKKLKSRKFCLAVLGFCLLMLYAIFAQDTIARCISILMAGVVLSVYIRGESRIDAMSVPIRVKKDQAYQGE